MYEFVKICKFDKTESVLVLLQEPVHTPFCSQLRLSLPQLLITKAISVMSEDIRDK